MPSFIANKPISVSRNPDKLHSVPSTFVLLAATRVARQCCTNAHCEIRCSFLRLGYESQLEVMAKQIAQVPTGMAHRLMLKDMRKCIEHEARSCLTLYRCFARQSWCVLVCVALKHCISMFR